MKLRTTIIATALVCSWTLVHAQDSSTQQNSQDSSRSDQSTQVDQSQSSTNNIISEPSGADRPRGRAFSSTNPPPGRAFSTNNPPQGRPFREGGRPPGRPFQEGEEAGIPTEEPAGAERPATLPDPLRPSAPQDPQSQDATNVEQKEISESAGAEKRSIDTSIQTESAGAQRGSADQIAKALAEIKTGTTATGQANVQLTQVIKTSIQGKTVPDEFIDRLSRDLSTSFATVQLKEDVRMQFAQALNTVLTATPGSQTQIEQALGTIQSLLIDNGVARPSARAVACDLHLIATEMSPDLKLSVPIPR